MLRSIIIPIAATATMLSGCVKGGFSLRGSECPDGQSRRGGSLCVPDEAESDKLGATTCKDPDLAALKAGVEVTMCNGSVGVGTLVVAEACSEDGQLGCVTQGDFKAVKTSNVEPSDIRLGKTIAGITGTKRDMKQCRNAAVNLSAFDYSSLANAYAGTSSPDGVANVWDTINDRNNDALVGPSHGPWGADYVCNESNFTNVSADGLPGLAPTNASVGGTDNFFAIWRDELTGLYFTNVLYDGSGALDWHGVMSLCANLNSGDGAGKWHLPTQKELLQLYVNGISRIAIDEANFNSSYLWSSTMVAEMPPGYAWYVMLSDASAYYNSLTDPWYMALCVR